MLQVEGLLKQYEEIHEKGKLLTLEQKEIIKQILQGEGLGVLK